MARNSQSQPFPATFPLNLDKRKKRHHGEDDEIETPAEQMFNILEDIQMKVVNLTTIVNEVSTKLDNHIANCGTSDHVKELKDQILSTQEALLSIDKSQYEEDKRRKFKCIPKWGELHKKRRDAYYKFFSVNSIANIMEQYISSDSPYIMRAYRPKYSPGEKEERYKLREKHSISAMMMDVNQKRITAREQYEIYTEVDADISKLCDELDNPEDSHYLKELWTKEVSTAEENSQSFFNRKKKTWWLDLSTKYPYNGQETSQSESVPNSNAEETPNVTPPNAHRPTTSNNNTQDEDDSRMDVNEPESNTNPWVKVSHNRGRKPTRRVHEHKHKDKPALTASASHHLENRGVRDQSAIRSRGGHRGQSVNRNRGAYRGRGISRGRTHSYTRGRSRGRGNPSHNSRRPNNQPQDFH